MTEEKICVAIVGIRFGAEFVPIYQRHPNVGEVVVCDSNEDRLREVGDQYGIKRQFSDLDELLSQPDIDAVHLLTPLFLHADQATRVLGAGKHCACAVTMGTTLEHLRQVIDAQRSSGKNYMMMETVVYSREYLFLKDLYDSGAMGELTFLRGTYFQDLEGYPDYWKSVPPMHYGTHAVAPLLAIAGTRAVSVNCLGSGLLSEPLRRSESSPFRLETGLFRLENSPVAAEVTRSWFETARPYVEAFHIYGTKMGFEWNQDWNEKPFLFTLGELGEHPGRPVHTDRIEIPDFADRLPESIREFTGGEGGGAHGGSHPHLVHEFVRSIVEARPPAIDAAMSATWTAPGLCAHESALKDGEKVAIPAYD